MKPFLYVVSIVTVIAATTLHAADTPSGQGIYQKRCAACHEQQNPRTPPRTALNNMSSVRILRALNSGVMMTIAFQLKRDEREAVAAFLGKAGAEPGPPASAYCKNKAVKVDDSLKAQWNGWSPTPTNARFQNGSGLSVDKVRGLKLKWAFAFEGDISSYAQPSVIGNQIFVGSAGGVIYALQADSGCIEWTYQASSPVRTAVSVARLAAGKDGSQKHSVLFGDLNANFYSVDAESGKQNWKTKVDDHEAALLTGAATVYDGVAYVPVASWEESRSINPEYQCCTFRGSVVAVRVRDGGISWKTYTIAEKAHSTGKTSAGTSKFGPSGAGVWGAPTVDVARKRLYIATGDNYSLPATAYSDAVMALDLATGKSVWSHQLTANDAFNSSCMTSVNEPNCPEGVGPDFDFGASVVLGEKLILAGQKSGLVYGLDPDKNGAVVWQTRVAKGGVIGGVQWGMASDGQNLYAAASDANVITRNQVRSLDAKSGGGLTALRVSDGSKAWSVAPVKCDPAQVGCSPAQSAAVTTIPGVVFSGSMDGHLRAYSSEDGKILWDFNTIREYNAVNGAKAKGGAMDGPGPVVANGMVFVNSGYARFGGATGNVLLAFGAE